MIIHNVGDEPVEVRVNGKKHPSKARERAALFTGDAHGSSGFVIDTPYVSVFSLGPDASSVIVALPRVFRDAILDGKGGISRRERRASWEVRLLTA